MNRAAWHQIIRRNTMALTSIPIHYWTATQLRAAYAGGAISPSEAAQACVERIEALNPRLNAYLSLNADVMQAAGRLAPAAEPSHWTPLTGVPYALKDNFDVAGMATTCHSASRQDVMATSDSDVAARLRGAGALLLGKNSLHELATGGPSFDLSSPPARNPWDRSRHPGGSSSGSGVAVATGMACFSIGTDTGGSVRHPATVCGVYGFKPSFDAVSMRGVVPLSRSLDHVGILTRGARDLALVSSQLVESTEAQAAHRALCGAAQSTALSEFTVGVIDSFSFELNHAPEIGAALEALIQGLERAGARVRRIAVAPLADHLHAAKTIVYAEAYAYHGAHIDAAPKLYGKRTRDRIGQGRSVSTAEYIFARHAQSDLTRQLSASHEAVDVALSFSSLEFPCAIDDVPMIARSYDLQARNPFNLTGLPAASVPCGLSKDGLPIGVQVSATTGRDVRLLDFLIALEDAGLCRYQSPPV